MEGGDLLKNDLQIYQGCDGWQGISVRDHSLKGQCGHAWHSQEIE